jgi:hypothetical protein
MAERKVLNKYYPPDFDPSKLRRFEKKTVRRMCNVRMMLPMSVRCYTCGNYMYIGTKFNMKVETVRDEDYLGIKVYRFYFKCTQCYAEITFKTDPKNHDYVAELGASRNHEPWKDMLMAEEEYKEMKQNEMKEDAMKSLEHRTYDSKREMDILDALDQVKNLNRRQAMINYDELIEKAVKEVDREVEEPITEDLEKEIKEKFIKNKSKRIEDYNNITSHDNENNISISTQFTQANNTHQLLGNKSKRFSDILNIAENESDSEGEKDNNIKSANNSNSLSNTLKLKVKKLPIDVNNDLTRNKSINNIKKSNGIIKKPFSANNNPLKKSNLLLTMNKDACNK